MIPSATSGSGLATASTDLSSAAADQQGVEFDTIILGIATQLLAVALEEGQRIVNEDI